MADHFMKGWAASELSRDPSPFVNSRPLPWSSSHIAFGHKYQLTTSVSIIADAVIFYPDGVLSVCLGPLAETSSTDPDWDATCHALSEEPSIKRVYYRSEGQWTVLSGDVAEPPFTLGIRIGAWLEALSSWYSGLVGKPSVNDLKSSVLATPKLP